MSGGVPRAVGLALLALGVAWATLVVASWWVTDDAYISYRYALQLTRGHGLVFNVGEQPPVEGYSNLGWVLISAGVLTFGGAPDTVMPVLSAACGLGLLAWVAVGARRRLDGSWTAVLAAVASLAMAPPFVVWSTGGLATMPAALALAVLVDGWILQERPEGRWWGSLGAAALVLLRTEGVGWVVVCAVLSMWARPQGRRRLVPALAVVGTVFLGVLAFRVGHHQAWTSNTAVAKLAWSGAHLGRGLGYVLSQWASDPFRAVLMALGIAGLLGRRARPSAALAVLAVAPWVYAVVVSGDFMAFGRLIVPSLPFMAVGIGAAVDRWRRAWPVVALGVALGLLPLADVSVTPRAWRAALDVRHNTGAYRTEAAQWAFMGRNARRWSDVGRALDQVAAPGDSLVVGAVGALGYHAPDLLLLDRFGLVIPEVARGGGDGDLRSPGHDRAVPITWFLDRRPTYLSADVARGPRARRTLRRIADRKLRRLAPGAYAPVLHRVELGGGEAWLMVHTRTEQAAAAWEAWDRRGLTPRRGRGAGAGAGRSAPPDPGEAQVSDSGG